MAEFLLRDREVATRAEKRIQMGAQFCWGAAPRVWRIFDELLMRKIVGEEKN